MIEGRHQYVLDANVFMEAARRYYAFDLGSRFWLGLTEQARAGCLVSVDRVLGEIDQGKDPLSEWAETDFAPWFVTTDEPDVAGAYGEIQRWAQSQQQFCPAAKAEFADAKKADAWVTAYAMARGAVVVTHETYDRNIKKKIKIPNVCHSFGIQYADTFEMMRCLGIRLG